MTTLLRGNALRCRAFLWGGFILEQVASGERDLNRLKSSAVEKLATVA
jgi:hypothetical protein